MTSGKALYLAALRVLFYFQIHTHIVFGLKVSKVHISKSIRICLGNLKKGLTNQSSLTTLSIMI